MATTQDMFTSPASSTPNVSLFSTPQNAASGFFAPALMNLIRDSANANRGKIVWGQSGQLPTQTPYTPTPTPTPMMPANPVPSISINPGGWSPGTAPTTAQPNLFMSGDNTGIGVPLATALSNPHPINGGAGGLGQMITGGLSGGPAVVPADLNGLTGQVAGQTDPSGHGALAQLIASTLAGAVVPGGGLALNTAVGAYPGVSQALRGDQSYTQGPSSSSWLHNIFNAGTDILGPAIGNAASYLTGNGAGGADAAGLTNLTSAGKGGLASLPATMPAGSISGSGGGQVTGIPGVTGGGTGSIFQVASASNPMGNFTPMGWNANPGPRTMAEGVGGGGGDPGPFATSNALPGLMSAFSAPMTEDFLRYYMQQQGQR